MRFHLSLGAMLLLAAAALTADPAFAQDKEGTICVENAGAFVIDADISFIGFRDGYYVTMGGVKTGPYPVLQTRCAPISKNSDSATIFVNVLAGVSQFCTIDLSGRAGKTITAKMRGTTLINQLDCPN